MKRKFVFFLLLFIITAASASVLTFWRLNQNSIEAEAHKIEHRLAHIEKSFTDFASDNDLIASIVNKEYNSKSLRAFSNFKFDFFIYSEDSLIFWSDNLAIPLYDINKYDEGSNFVKLKNGWYELNRFNSGGYIVVGIIPIKSNYNIENAYLKNIINPDFRVDERLEVSPTVQPDGAVVKNIDGKPLFSIKKSGISETKAWPIEQILYWIALGLFCLALHFFSLTIFPNNKLLALLQLIVSFAIVRLLIHFIDFPFSNSSIALFDPSIYASGIFSKSLGEMLINVGMLLWVVSYCFIHIRKDFEVKNIPGKVAAYLSIALFLIAIQQIIKSFVIDSNISFELDNFLELSVYSLTGLTLIAFTLLSFWMFSFALIQSFDKRQLLKKDLILLFPAIMLILIYEYFSIGIPIGLFAVVWFALLVLLLHNYFRSLASIRSFAGIIIIIFLFSFWVAITMEYYNHKKELANRQLFAVELAEERDLMTESLLNDIKPRIESDEFIKAFFTNPYVSKRDIIDRIAYLYMRDISKKYDFSVYAFDSDGEAFKNTSEFDFSHFENRITKDCDTIIDNNLFFIPEKNGKFAYFVEFPLNIDDELQTTLLIELKPKIFTTTNVYPELLLEERFSNPISKKYIYALYAYGSLIGQKGDFPYDFFLDQESLDVDEFEFINTQQYSHLVYCPTTSKTIIVSIERERWLKPLAVFSYLFCFFLFISMILSSVFLLKKLIEKRNKNVLALSFRNRITVSMILIIIVSFLIIGLVTARYFTNEYELYHQQRLIRKEKAVRSAIEYLIKDNTDLNESISNDQLIKKELTVDIASLSDIHSMDINIFNLDGDLLISSKPEIFTKGLVSDKMNPLAYYHLSDVLRNQYLHQESIGKLQYLSVYVPIRNETGETLAYMNLPYFAQASNLKEEISNFMVALVNVYVFLLVCAGFIAFLISNSITRPLTEIREKLRLLNLTRSNEPIEWRRKDEIGELVSEYNKMIRELEKSVQLLAKSERESAWREMAKQIAHEIKNPLTPMKLSIQYLQRSIEANDGNKDELVDRVSKTLIEQIDNLSEIATAFSSFAKMPKAKNEVMNLEDVARSVFDLFKDTHDIEYHFHSDLDDPQVFADKNQLISAFNNLMQNATQSISDEQKGNVEMNLRINEDKFIIEVKDNGIGIEKHLQESVFVPNFTTKSSGTGLGLAITKRIIENAGGDIWFESAVGQGSAFYISLPMYDE
ncbi:MAG: HAMP domain-containing histidine kinase [Chitinophagales bacterium]|nr:HAMP domain-containing histidine kinase [Chitinophagales bacterium]